MTTDQGNDGSPLDFSVNGPNRLEEDPLPRSRRRGGLIGQFRKTTITMISAPSPDTHRTKLWQFRAQSISAGLVAQKNAKTGGSTIV